MNNRVVIILYAIISLVVALAVTAAMKANANPITWTNERQLSLVGVVFVTSFALLSLPRLWQLMNGMAFRQVEGLGDVATGLDERFRSKVSGHFGDELVENIVAYETFCKNEYKLEMRKHHFAWLMLALSGLITLGAGIIMIWLLFSNPAAAPAHSLITTIPAGLTALVTGILVKIWLDTGNNVQRARARSELLHRQRIRLLFLLGKRTGNEKVDLSKMVADANLMLDYIRVAGEPAGQSDPLQTKT